MAAKVEVLAAAVGAPAAAWEDLVEVLVATAAKAASVADRADLGVAKEDLVAAKVDTVAPVVVAGEVMVIDKENSITLKSFF